MTFYAKSPRKDGTRETVQEHLRTVEQLAGTYGSAFGQAGSAKLCGLFHDFGKYSTAFQNVLSGTQTDIDHAVCGALLLFLTRKKSCRPIIEAIAAHHSRLVSQEDLAGTLTAVLHADKPVTTLAGKQAALCGAEDYQNASRAFQADFPTFQFPKLPEYMPSSQEASMLYTRMLFSCLVDADYTASSENIMEEGKPLDVSAGLHSLYAYCKALKAESHADPLLNQFRNQLFDRCGQSGEQPGGIFTLTAPTGTGKTLALLHFALRHCQYTGKRRIIVVLPFLSLVEQNAGIYRKIIPEAMEDHSQSNLPDELREHAARWDPPFLITTSVRFFESLFSDCPADCRKLHNIAGSVILFDEAQSLPLSLLAPTLKAVQELCTVYHCSMVFSTATQPDYSSLPSISWKPAELLPEYRTFYKALRRTEVVWELDVPTPLEEIAEQMAKETNICTIVNLRAHARKLFRSLKERCPGDEIFLLTTDLCPAHRTEVIRTIRERQKERLPCRVVSTQCIEAGVDLDFCLLYRALAPLEAIIQAAGRCNRNGTSGQGEIRVFIPEEEHLYPDSHYENGATTVRAMQMNKTLQIHDPDCIKRYYERLYGTFRGDARSQRLEKAIRERDFFTVSETYRLIKRRGIQVIVPYAAQKELYQKIRREALQTGLTKSLLRQAAPLTVSCFDRETAEQVCEPLYFADNGRPGNSESPFLILLSGQESCYDGKMGFCPPDKEPTKQGLFW